MAKVEFIDHTEEVEGLIAELAYRALEESAGELESQVKRNTRVDTGQTKNSWKHRVTGSMMAGEYKAEIGSPMENAIWEEFGTGEHALNGDGRKGWWVYIEGKASGKGGKSYSTKAEAEEAAEFLRKVKGLDAYATNGIDPNRPLHRAFQSGQPVVQAILGSKLKGMG
jgi:hypothetical protein